MNWKKSVGILILVLFLVGGIYFGRDTLTGLVIGDSCFSFEGSARDECYLETKSCSKIESLTLRDSCVGELAKAKKDAAVCKLVVDEKSKANCQEELALLTNNHDLCTEITDPYWNDNCNYHLAVQNNKDVYCSLVDNLQQRADCFQTIAFATNNYSLCEFFTGDVRDGCYYRIATALKDSSVCQHSSTLLQQDACTLKVAKVSNDSSLCPKIHFSDVKKICEEYLSGKRK